VTTEFPVIAPPMAMETEMTETTQKKPPLRKRSFERPTAELIPYRRKPRTSKFEFTVKKSDIEPVNLVDMERRDMAWIISCALLNHTPMWIGWNSLFTVDKCPQQIIGYMENLSLPPTRLDVVAETL